MKQQILGGSTTTVSRIGMGCMHWAELTDAAATQLLQEVLDLGVNFFDHADIYGAGQAEKRFGTAWRQLGVARDRLIVQSKCGICRGYYDNSPEHIVRAVHESLRRLRTDYLDVLLLHRPDVLSNPEMIAEAFERLHRSGTVRYFGVSNHNVAQMAFLQQSLPDGLAVNQLQLSLAHTALIDSGLHVNTRNEQATDRDGGILAYCQLHRVSVQAWSPLQIDLQQGTFLNHPKYEALNHALAEIARDYGGTPAAVALAWILRHPAHIQPLVGSIRLERWRALALADEMALSRSEWYHLYQAAGNPLP